MHAIAQRLSQLGAAITPALSLVMRCQRVFPVMTLTLGGRPFSAISFDPTDSLPLVEWLCGVSMDWLCLGYIGSCSPWQGLGFDWPRGPSCCALGQLLVRFRGFASSFGDSLFDCVWERRVVAPVTHLLFGGWSGSWDKQFNSIQFGSLVPHHAHCPILMGRAMGVGPGNLV